MLMPPLFIYVFLEFDAVSVYESAPLHIIGTCVYAALHLMELTFRFCSDSRCGTSLVHRRVHNLIQLLVHYLLLCSPFTQCPRTPAILMTCSVLHCFMFYLSFLLNVFMIFTGIGHKKIV